MTEKKRKTTYSIGIVLLGMLLGLLVGVMFGERLNRVKSPQVSATNTSSLISQVLALVDRAYVDKVDYDSVSGVMINAMLSSLDPHSGYMSAKETKSNGEMMEGHFEGVGILLHQHGDTVFASSITPHSPASKAGVLPGDRILKVDTTWVSGRGFCKDMSNVVNLIRGPRYSTVTLGIQRGNTKKIQYIKLQRDVIPQKSVSVAMMLDKTTGYIYIAHFSGTTATEFHSALLQLNKEGMKHLVLDLRGNPGGSLETAIRVADEMLPKGDLIVYTEGQHYQRERVKATSGGLFEEGQLTVLMNAFSASGSEVVAGALQDNDRATIVGHRSFGKGLVQRQFDMSDGSSLRLTVARYYSPSGRCIQRPYDKGSDEYYMDFLNSVTQDYELADSVMKAVYDTTQLFYTKKGRKVYGGGGIQPDVVLPYMKDSNLVYYNSLINKQIFDALVMDELSAHYADMIKRYPTAEVFLKEYKVDDATLQRIIARGEKAGIKRNDACLKRYGQEILSRYKASLAMSLYDDDVYYSIMLPYDWELQKALKTNYKL
ncbi:MAG: S41 family peptidase [Bacteroidales bacterium]|nr:S41 family peptidase [Bacteroidales bacterium]